MTETILKPASITFNLRNGYLRCESYTPANAHAVVVLTHGTGLCRTNRHLRHIVGTFYANRIALVTADVLTAYELADHKCRLDTELVSQRLIMLVQYLRELPLFSDLPVSFIGIGTGADGVLSAAARIPGDISAVAAINGLKINAGNLKKIFPPSLPVLLLQQEVLGQAAPNGNGFTSGNGNIMVKKIFKSDESIPWEAMDEATGWLCHLLIPSKRKVSGLAEMYEPRG